MGEVEPLPPLETPLALTLMKPDPGSLKPSKSLPSSRALNSAATAGVFSIAAITSLAVVASGSM